MPDSGYPEIFGPDLTPVRAKDLVAIAKGAMERPGATPQDDDEERGVLGEAVEMSTAQFAEAAVTFAALWESVAWFLEEENKKRRGPGRPREHSVAQALLVWMMKSEEMSERAIIVELRDHWPRICAAAAAAWPNHPNRRMPDRPISRRQYRHFASRHLVSIATADDEVADDEIVDDEVADDESPEADEVADDEGPEARENPAHERLVLDMMRVAAKAARYIGMLDPSDGSLNRPSSARTLYGDETFIRDRFNRKPDDCFNAKGEQIYRFDPDSRVRYTNNLKDKGARGYKVFTISVRNDWVNQRIILATGVRGTGVTEANNFIDKVRLLREVCPEVRDGANTATYDGAVHAVHVDELYDQGVIPTMRTPMNNRSEPASIVLHDTPFKCRDGQTRRSDVRCIHGTPTLDFVDGDGYEAHQPLRSVNTYPRKNADGTLRWYQDVEVPQNILLGPLSEATATLRLDSPPQECKPGRPRRRTTALRALTSTSPYYRRVKGRREDSESTNNNIKAILPNRRVRSIGTPRVDLDQLGFQAHTTIKALIHHYYENGGDITEFFGQRPPITPRPPRAKPPKGRRKRRGKSPPSGP